MAKPNLAIEIKGETYRLDEEPAPDSTIVVTNMKSLFGEVVTFEEVINGFGRLGVMVNLAYNGAVAAGPKYIDIQLDIQTIGHSLADLFDESVLTVSEFKRSSERVLGKIQSMYYFLINNHERQAIEMLISVAKTSEDMAVAANDLRNRAKKEQENIESVINLMGIDNITEYKHDIQSSINAVRKEIEDAIDKENEARKVLEEYERNNKEAINRMGNMGIIKNFINVVASVVRSKPFSEEEYAKIAQDQAKIWRENAHHAELKLSLQTERRIRFEKQMEEFARQMRDIKADDQDMAKTIVHALHEAISALKEIGGVMQDVAFFWAHLEISCKDLKEVAANDLLIPLDSRIDDGKKSPESVWTADFFKKIAINYYASWVAMKTVCSDSEPIKLARIELKNMMLANPTREESFENIKFLAKKLPKHVHDQA